jgi:hypothetical protein
MTKTKNCLVTGAAAGLGLAFAKLAIEDGYDLILIDIDAQKLIEVKKDLEKSHNQKVTILTKDLCKPNIAAEIYTELQAKNIEMLINNAGFGVFGKFNETDWKREENMMNLHMITSTHLTKLFLKNMIDAKTGFILNVSSLAAFQPGPLMAIYYASKSFLLSFSEAIAREIKGSGVSISVLCPGPTKTNFQSTVSENTSKNKISANMANVTTVASIGYNGLKKGKVVIIPGITNQFLSFLPRLLPRKLAASIVYKIQLSNRDLTK